MTALQNLLSSLQSARKRAAGSTTVFLRDVGHGLLEVSHNTLALVGLLIVAVLVFMLSHRDMRQSVEQKALSWLQARHEARTAGTLEALAGLNEPDAITRATASDPRELTRQQAAVASWLSRRYRVAPEPVARLVQEAWTVGAKANLEPTLILAIMAIESSFNPFAQSPVGAQGLMQVMTRVHDDKYEPFGGNHAAFDPVTNLRVGVQVLKECISRAGSLEAGLRYYVGAANLPDDGGYASKVLAEQEHLRQVAAGKSVSITAPLILPTPVTVPATLTGPDAKPVSPGEKSATEQVALAG
ncbi:lytic transglycosylase domain-containing protein [Rhizobacter sp. J219]|uniref:lytic transglycosylase domain-containing protein n=1 Tax=Rhizobacter sp. J219 TaxID=2898430 RepID=UPI0021512258|nr:lytic transglycosylase domain-containing protein [Rhizobacter sp. J219]MCR5883345.1 lytic transglycosylase domain-containing protein [Rhizobacter sp. J219]